MVVRIAARGLIGWYSSPVPACGREPHTRAENGPLDPHSIESKSGGYKVCLDSSVFFSPSSISSAFPRGLRPVPVRPSYDRSEARACGISHSHTRGAARSILAEMACVNACTKAREYRGPCTRVRACACRARVRRVCAVSSAEYIVYVCKIESGLVCSLRKRVCSLRKRVCACMLRGYRTSRESVWRGAGQWWAE